MTNLVFNQTDWPDFLAGGGEMGALMRAKDWSATPLGPAESWPASLRTMVSLLLANRFPMLLWWGPHYLSIYNDAYRPILGNKHPEALGQPVRECWSEIWHILKPLIDTPFNGGPATWMDDLPLEINRHGFVEETHFTIAYSPVPDEGAPRGIGGVLATVHEITGKIIGERRVLALRDLSVGAAEGRTAAAAAALAAEVLAEHAKDVPFALIYLLDADGRHARLAGAAGIAIDLRFSPSLVDLGKGADAETGWPLAEAVRREAMITVETLTERFGRLPPGPWSVSPDQAVIVPIRSNKAHELAGLLVAGVSAQVPLDELYRSFFELLAGQIATAIANARAHEEERRRAQALAEIDRAKTMFFSNVSHEFRTPLTLMLGPLEAVLERPSLAAAEREQLGVAHRNGLRLLKLVNSLLDFSQVEAGRVQAVYRATDLAAFTAAIASNFRSASERAGLRLVVHCPPLPQPIYLDRDMWEKIVLNLVSNAFKFTFEGEIAVTVEARDGTAELLVRDTGTGIPEAELPRIFERFHRVEHTRTRTHEGTGIGLALVQELVRLHGGSVGVASTPGSGTSFTVRIPFGTAHLPADRIDAQQAAVSTATRAAAFVEEALRWLVDADGSSATAAAPTLVTEALPPTASAATGRPRVLIADDNADMRDHVRRILATRYEVEAVGDGRAALVAAEERRPDLLLADVMMPGLDGFGLLRAVRASPGLCDLPVVMLSARAGEEARVEGLEAGADDYLVKPFGARELLARVTTHLDLARLRREAAEAVRESEERFRQFGDASSDILWIYNARTLRWEYLSPAFEAICGTDRETVLAGEGPGRWTDRIVEADREHAAAGIARVGAGESISFECRVRRPDGGTRWLSNTAFPMRGAGGAVERIGGIGQDVTALKRTEAALRDEEARQRALVEGLPQLIWRSGADGSWTWSSRQWREYTGQSEEQSRGWGWLDALHQADHEAVRDAWLKARPNGLLKLDCRIRHAESGRYAWFQTRGVPVGDAGRTGEWIGSCTDIDDQMRAREVLARSRDELETLVAERTADLKAAEERLRQVQKLEAVGQLTGGIAHDFNNMLQGIASALHLARRRLANARADEVAPYLEMAARSVERAAGLTQRLLAFARRQHLDPKPVDADGLIAGLADLIRRTVGPGIAVELRLGDGAATVLCDQNELESALLNLCINARDAMPEGGRLTLGTAEARLSAADLQGEEAAPGRYVTISIADSGTGIPPELLERVFEPFFTTKPHGQGTGLGLSQVYGFVRQSGGLVRIESAEGRGTTVRLFLPLTIGAVAADRPCGLPSLPTSVNGTVLLVDDEDAVRRLAADWLRELGLAVLEAGSGPDALRLLASSARPDLLVTDVGLPGGMNGRQVAEAARERIPGLPVLFISGYAGPSLPPGMEVIGKPFDLDSLARRVEAMLDGSRRRPGALPVA